MKSIYKLSYIVVYDSNHSVFTSIPVLNSMTVADINNIIRSLHDALPKTFSFCLE